MTLSTFALLTGKAMLAFRTLSVIAFAATLFEACTVLTEVDRDLVRDEPEAGADASSPPAAGGTAGSGGGVDAAPDVVVADAPADGAADAPDEAGDAGDAVRDGDGEAGIVDGGGLSDSSVNPGDSATTDADASPIDAPAD